MVHEASESKELHDNNKKICHTASKLSFPPFLMKISRALLSVSDKSGIVEFAQFLDDNGVEIISTGGTARSIREAGIAVKDISEITNFPEMLDGRVKTLHPAIHGGILFVRGNDTHEKTVEEHQIGAIDLVVVNLYPFEQTVARGATEAETIENIDIGGPSMLRSAAKNFAAVTVVCDPTDLAQVKAEIIADGGTTYETRRYLAGKVFQKSARYDAAIAHFFDNDFVGKFFTNPLPLKYGENPHQQAQFYPSDPIVTPSIGAAKILQGKQMGYCNYLDADGAYNLILEFTEPAAAIIKHATPCGVAVGKNVEEAFIKALATNPVSAFGGIIAVNRTVTKELAEEIVKTFFEVVIAPQFDLEALTVFTAKPNLRLLETGEMKRIAGEQDMRAISGGILQQDRDAATLSEDKLQEVVGKLEANELADVLFAWQVVKHVKSNAIVIVKNGQTLGLGGGQTSRVDASRIAMEQAGDKAQGAIAASDAFFPFADGVEFLAKAGVSVIVQPGGSIKDEEVFAAAKTLGIKMVLTGTRAFRH